MSMDSMPCLRSAFAGLVLLSLTACSSGSSGGGAAAPATPILVNNIPTAQVVTPTGTQSANVTIDVTLTDADGDSVELVVEFSLDGVTFTTATLFGSPSLTGLVADDDGELHTFAWDTVADTVGLAVVENQVTVRVTPRDAEQGVEVSSGVFTVDNVPPPGTAPLVTTISPTFGNAGTIVTIDGFNLGTDVSAITAAIGSQALTVLSVTTDLTTSTSDGNPSTVTVSTTPEVVQGVIDLVVSGTLLSSTETFTTAPRLQAITPGGIPEDGALHTVQLFGDRLDLGASEVVLTSGGVETIVTPSSVTATEVQFDVPLVLVPVSGGSKVDVQVQHAGGRSNPIQILHSESTATPLTMPPVVSRLVVHPRVAAGLVPVDFSVFDFGTDVAALTFEYSIDGGALSPCSEASMAPLAATVATTAIGTGLPHTFVWDASTDVGTALQTEVRLFVTAIAPSVAVGGRFESAPFWTQGGGVFTFDEPFDDNAREDSAVTTADWNNALGSTFGMAGALVGLADAPTELPWGDGSDGAFAPVTDVTLVTDGVDPVFGGQDGVFRFSSFDLPAGVTLTVDGSNPLDLRVAGSVSIHGTIDVSGSPGTAANIFGAGAGGAARAGGTIGGGGGSVSSGLVLPGQSAARGGRGGETSLSLHAGALGGGGGGGGLAAAGGSGETTAAMGSGRGGVGGITRGFAAHQFLFAGAGGGGGGASVSTGTAFGGGAGGGGGAVCVTAQLDITISGTIHAHGGDGGLGMDGGCGGGGSGGLIALATPADIVFEDGVELGANGGAGGAASPTGGDGSDGRVVLTAAGPVTLPTPGGGGPTFDLTNFQPGLLAAGFSFGGFTPGSFDAGSGGSGAFAPTSDVTLNTLGIDPFGGLSGRFQFSSIDIPAGVTVTVVGPNPLELLSTGDVDIAGTIVVSGNDAPQVPFLPFGTAGAGGVAGPGGGNGGAGGSYSGMAPTGTATAASDGFAPPLVVGADGGGGAETVDVDDNISTAGGGGGGGNALLGFSGSDGVGPSGTDGATPGGAMGTDDFREPGDPDAIVRIGGAGGGGGGANADGGLFGGTGGGGGGGGGGVVHIVSATTLTLAPTAVIRADGGNGAACELDPAGKGGGGAGGGVLLQAEIVDIQAATVTALGGASLAGPGTEGGGGSVGRIRVEEGTSGGAGLSGTIDPVPALDTFDGGVRRSVASSIPIVLENEFGFPVPAARVVSATATPAASTNTTVLWGVWQQSDAGPVEFSGFTDDLASLPRAEFIQFMVYMQSAVTPAVPATLDQLQANIEQ